MWSTAVVMWPNAVIMQPTSVLCGPQLWSCDLMLWSCSLLLCYVVPAVAVLYYLQLWSFGRTLNSDHVVHWCDYVVYCCGHVVLHCNGHSPPELWSECCCVSVACQLALFCCPRQSCHCRILPRRPLYVLCVRGRSCDQDTTDHGTCVARAPWHCVRLTGRHILAQSSHVLYSLVALLGLGQIGESVHLYV